MKKRWGEEKAASEDQVLKEGKGEQMWFLATCNQIWLSGYSIKSDTKMFSETRRGHSEDQWTLGGQVSLYTHCFTMVRAQEHGTKSLAVLGHKGQSGPALGHYCKERFSQVLCGFKRRGNTFLHVILTLPAPEARKFETSTCASCLSFSNSEKAT